MSFEKENFLRTRLITYLQRIPNHTTPLWGSMTLQQMIEHLGGDAVRIASGELRVDRQYTTAEQELAFRDFLYSDRAFKKNIRNPLLPEKITGTRYRTIGSAISSLHQDLIHFFDVFAQNPSLKTRNPFYGELNFDENVLLLYKHSRHHLEQFGVQILER